MHITHLVECLPRIHEALSSISVLQKQTVTVHACDPRTREVQEGESEVQDHPQLYKELKTSLS